MTTKNIQHVLDLLTQYDCAPNPFGFCFETGDDTTIKQAKELSKALDALSPREEEILKREVF